MTKSKCPFCEKEFENILKHFVIVHKIKDVDHLKDEIDKTKKEEGKRIEFGKYIDELNDKMKKGEISAKDYRELVTRWWKKH